MTDPRDVAQAWVQQYADRVFRLTYALIGERTRAEDAAQDSLYHIARWLMHHPDFRPTDAWVYQVTRNAVRDLARHAAPPTVPLEESQAAESKEDQRVERMDVKRALEQLPDSDREILVFSYYLDLSTKEMARILSTSEAAVRIRLTRARKKFRQVFESEAAQPWPHGKGRSR
jgi:RNA polymerase sigma-70 factor (ECF subfamily)